jgi:hypothetical protein
MERVGHDDVGLGHGGHHPLLDHLTLDAANPRSNQRVAFRFLVFLLDLLPGHPQPAGPFIPLVEIIDCGDGGDREADDGPCAQPQRADRIQDAAEVVLHELREDRHIACGHEKGRGSDDRHFQPGFDQFRQRSERQQTLQPGHRAEPAAVEGQDVGPPNPSRLGDRGDDADQGQARHEREQQDHQVCTNLTEPSVQMIHGQLSVRRRIAQRGELALHETRQSQDR